jgi:hypothetical protein
MEKQQTWKFKEFPYFKLIKHSSQNYPHPYPQGVDFFVDKICGHGAKFFYYDHVIKSPEII